MYCVVVALYMWCAGVAAEALARKHSATAAFALGMLWPFYVARVLWRAAFDD